MIEESFIESLLLSQGDVLKKVMLHRGVSSDRELSDLVQEAIKFNQATIERVSAWFSAADKKRKKSDVFDDVWLTERSKYAALVATGIEPHQVCMEMIVGGFDPVLIVRGLRDLFSLSLDKALLVYAETSQR